MVTVPSPCFVCARRSKVNGSIYCVECKADVVEALAEVKSRKASHWSDDAETVLKYKDQIISLHRTDDGMWRPIYQGFASLSRVSYLKLIDLDKYDFHLSRKQVRKYKGLFRPYL